MAIHYPMKATKPVNIPVLMYHAITGAGVMAENPVHVSLDNFMEQMNWLQRKGYEAVSIHDFFAIITGNKTAPKNPVLITFDDGYLSQFNRATPVLEKHGFKAVLFLTVNGVGQKDYNEVFPFPQDCPATDRPLNWQEIGEMEKGLWDIEAHGCRHVRHAFLSAGEISAEIQHSKLIIEKHLQKQVGFYAYPYGNYNAGVLKEISRQNYLAAFAVHPGLANCKNDLRRFHRIEINRHDTLSSFIRKTTTGYVSGKQKMVSALRNRIFRSARLKDVIMMIAGNRIN